MTNPFERYLQEDAAKKKKSDNPFEAYLGSDQPETHAMGFVHGSYGGREGVLGKAEDLGRGVLYGTVTGLPGLAEVGAGLAAKVPILDKVAKPTQEFLKKYREEALKEIDPQGIAGAVGELGSVMLPGNAGKLYGKIYEGPGAAVARKVAPKMSEKLFTKAAEKATGVGDWISKVPARAAANVVKGVPFQVAVGLGQDDPEQAKKQIALGIVGDLIFGGAQRGGHPTTPKAEAKTITKENLPTEAAPTANLPPDRLVQLAEITQKGLEKKAAQEAKTKLRRIVAGRYQGETGNLFKDLPKAEQQRMLQEFIAANPEHPAVKGQAEVTPASTPEIDKQADIVAATTTARVEEKVAEVLEAKPDATHEEIKAEVEKLPEVKRAQQSTRRPSPADGTTFTTTAGDYKLPDATKKMSPRYRDAELVFDSDFDKTAYVLQGANKSKAHDAILKHVMEQTGLTEQQIKSHGAMVKESLKSVYKGPGMTKVPKVNTIYSEHKPFTENEDQRILEQTDQGEVVVGQAPESGKAGVPEVTSPVEAPSAGMSAIEVAAANAGTSPEALAESWDRLMPQEAKGKMMEIARGLDLPEGSTFVKELYRDYVKLSKHKDLTPPDDVAPQRYDTHGRRISDTGVPSAGGRVNKPRRSEFVPGARMGDAIKLVGQDEFNRLAEAERTISGGELYDARNIVADRILSTSPGEHVAGATIKLKDGTIIKADSHWKALEEAKAKGLDVTGAEDGFFTNKREHISRTDGEYVDAIYSGNEPAGEELHTNRMPSDTELDTSIPESQQIMQGGNEPLGSTEAHAKEVDEIMGELEKRGAFKPRENEPGRAIEDYNAVLREIRDLQKQNLPHDEHMNAIADIIDIWTPLSDAEIHEVMQMEEAMARQAPEEPVPLTPEEEAALIAETQGLMPPAPEEPSPTNQAAPEQGALTPDVIPDTPPPAPEAGGEAPPPPDSGVFLESAPGDITALSDRKLNRAEDEFLKRLGKEDLKPAEREMLERDLTKIMAEQKRREAGTIPERPEFVLPEGVQVRPELPPEATGAAIGPSGPAPERPVTKVKVKAEGQTFLATVSAGKAIEDMTTKEREKWIDKIRSKINSLDPLNDRAKIDALQTDLDTLIEIQAGGVSAGGSVAAKASIASQKEAQQISRGMEGAVELDNATFVKLSRASLRSMNIKDLKDYVYTLTGKIEGNPDPDAVKAYTEKLHKAMEEVAARSVDASGIAPKIPPGIGGGTLGYLFGFYTADDDEDRVANGFMWAAVGATGGMIGGRLVRRGGAPKVDRTPAELPGGDWQAQVGQHIVSADITNQRPVPFLERMRKIYFDTIRRSYVAERFMQSIGASGLRTVSNPARLMEMFGRWTAQTEATLRSGPSVYDEFGNERHLTTPDGAPVPGAHEILKDVDGDVETLGTLMAVRTVIEHGGTIKVPFDMVAAVNAFHRIPEQFHRAADKARSLSLGMVEVLADGGIIARDKLKEFSDERWYAALERVFKFDPDMGGPAAEKGQNLSVGAQNPFKTRKKGSKDAIKNPFKTLIESIPRFYRAAELNKIKTSFVDAWEAAGKPEEWMKLISGKDAGDYDYHLKKVDELKAEIKNLSDDHAHAMVAAFDPSAVNVEKGTMRIYRNGKIQHYRIHADLARALLSLNPDEMHWATRMMGAPARLASTGVVMNPFFVAKMGFFDAFQATLNSRYGFRPGIDNVRGWWNIVTRSKEYQRLLSVGLSHQSLAGANVENIKTTFDALERTRGTPMEVALRHLKEARPLEFYKALVAPIADAARVGEALRALDHGASTLDAVYAAKTVTGNYQERGAWAGMRALQHMTMFLGPALQVLDTAAYRGGVHPFRVSEAGRIKDFANYGWKAFATIALPSMYFWAASHDDEEIKQLRTADAGRKWWFYRLPWDVGGHGKKGDIIKIPKPILDGQLMGTTAEIVLDAMFDKDPVQAGDLAKSIAKDAMFNLTPTIGVIPFSLQAGQDLSRGYELYPSYERELDMEHRGEASASFMSRMIAKKIAPAAEAVTDLVPLKALENAATPAGLDYLANAIGGMLGRDALLLAGQAAEYHQKGYVPAARELPIIKEVLVTTPSLRTRDIQQFYRHAEEFEKANNTFNHWMKEDITQAVPYFEANIDKIANAKTFDTTRSMLAQYRRAIADVKDMDASIISSEDRRKLIADYTQQMLDMAKVALDVLPKK